MRNPTKTREPAAVDPVARAVDEPVDPSTATAAVATRPARRGKGGRPRVERPPRTEGERLFRALPGSQEDVAEALGVSQAAASAWATGARRPQPDTRRTIARVFGIDPSAWDRRPASEGAPEQSEPSGNASSAPAPDPAPRGAGDVQGLNVEDEPAPHPDPSPAAVVPDEAPPPAHELASALLARVPAPLVVGAMLRALEGHPVALEAVRTTLDALEGASALLGPVEPHPTPPAVQTRPFAPAPHRRRPVDDDDDDDPEPVSDDPYAAGRAWGER